MTERVKQQYLNFLKQHLFPVSLLALAMLFQLSGPSVLQALCYERESIFSGQIWRLFSAHLVHLGWAHFSLNMVAFAMVWFLFWREWQQWVWILMFTFISLGTSLGLLMLQPTLDWSVGLSGVLHGLFAAGAIGALNRRLRLALIMLSILVLKLIWEQVGSIPGTETWIGGSVITAAHFYGAISGTIIAFLLLINKTSILVKN